MSRIFRTFHGDSSNPAAQADERSETACSAAHAFRTDSLDRVTRFKYDTAGRLTAQVDALGGRTEFGYDAAGNRTRVTDAKNHTTTFTYDALNRLLTETDPLDRTHSRSYDEAGQLASTTDAKGQTITYAYDDANRLLSKNYPDSTQETYAYDDSGNLLNAANPAVSMSYTYDARNLQLTITNDTIDKTVAYTYDENGRKVSLTYPDGETIAYTRDARGQVGHLESNQPGPGGEPAPWVNYAYNPDGSPSTMDYQFGMHVARTYDPAGRLIDLKYTKPDGSIISDFAYTHDAAGNILSKTTDFGLVQYGYDALDRLVLADYDWKADETFAYDPVGNRTADADNPVWQYDAADQLLAYSHGSLPVVTFTYDKNGSTDSKTEINGIDATYRYDCNNQLQQVRLNGVAVTEYSYDYGHQRIKKASFSDGLPAGTVWFMHGREGLLVEYDTAGTAIKKYAWRPDHPWGTGPLWQHDLEGIFSIYINDHLDTPQKMVNSAFASTWQGDWKAFGEIDEVVSLGSNQLRFAGQFADETTGLYHNWHREYDWSTGRYLQDNWDGYNYTGARVTAGIDYLGLDWTPIGGGFSYYWQPRSDGNGGRLDINPPKKNPCCKPEEPTWIQGKQDRNNNWWPDKNNGDPPYHPFYYGSTAEERSEQGSFTDSPRDPNSNNQENQWPHRFKVCYVCFHPARMNIRVIQCFLWGYQPPVSGPGGFTPPHPAGFNGEMWERNFPGFNWGGEN